MASSSYREETCFLFLFFVFWLFWVFVAACRIFSCGRWTLNFSMWDLVPWPGIEPRPLAIGAQSLNRGPPGKSWDLVLYLQCIYRCVCSRKVLSKSLWNWVMKEKFMISCLLQHRPYSLEKNSRSLLHHQVAHLRRQVCERGTRAPRNPGSSGRSRCSSVSAHPLVLARVTW